jgi:hypothetical protein
MRYRLRSLVILTAVVPPVLAVAWWAGLLLVPLLPRPRSYAEAFVCFLVCFNLTFVGCYIVSRFVAYSRSSNT